jgi:hypothetical protein
VSERWTASTAGAPTAKSDHHRRGQVERAAAPKRGSKGKATAKGSQLKGVRLRRAL